MPRALLALGSNLGDREAILESAAAAAIGELPAGRLIRRSSWHATEPVGGPAGQGEFLNGAVLMETELSPGGLLRELQRIESQLGRERTERWAARTLDIDILLYGDQIVDERELRIPHPRMSFRPFVLAPAAEIAAEMVHPELGVSIGTLWNRLQDGDDVVVVCGGLAEDRRELMENLLCRFRPHSLEGLSKLSEEQRDHIPALRIRDNALLPEALCIDRIHASDTEKLPKLQFCFEVPANGFVEYLKVRGSLLDNELWRRALSESDAPNPMVRLFTGIPTLVLDPREEPAHLLTESAAALEAVWPDLCRPGA